MQVHSVENGLGAVCHRDVADGKSPMPRVPVGVVRVLAYVQLGTLVGGAGSWHGVGCATVR